MQLNASKTRWVCLGLALAVFGCSDDKEDEPAVPTIEVSANPASSTGVTAISGTLRDFADASPIPGGRVSLYPGTGQAVLSRADGAYLFDKGIVPEQLYTVVAEAEGYLPGEAPVVAKSARGVSVDVALVSADKAWRSRSSPRPRSFLLAPA